MTPYIPSPIPFFGQNWWVDPQQQARVYEQIACEAQLASLRMRLSFTDSPGLNHIPTQTQGPSSTPFVTPWGTYRPNEQADFSKPYRLVALISQSKFSAGFAATDFPAKIKMPSTVGKYDGSGDPDDHINIFISAGGV
jgi:hypothetical protein